MAARREQFVTTKEFLDSARSLGIKSLEGICELIDNAFDADAYNIRIHIENNKDGTLQIIFVDDGLGIPSIHIDEEGKERQGIPYILAYGGRIPHPNRPEPIGKFGWGLSQTASCLSRRTEVYSRTEEDAGWRSCWYDFEELLADDCELPLETPAKTLPWLIVPETGTIIAMREVDQSEYATAKGLHDTLVSNLGRIYRYFLEFGRTVTVTYSEGDKAKETQIQISDPLMQLPNSREVKLAGFSIEKGLFTITLDEENEFGSITNRDGKPSQIVIRLVRLDVEQIRRSLGVPISGSSSGGTNKLVKQKLGISPAESGFSIIRNGREIATGQTLDLFTRVDWLNYFRAEILFSESLDDLFGVKTNKSRYRINSDLRNLLKKTVIRCINEIQSEHRKEVERLSAKREVEPIPRAEVIAAKAAPMLTRRRVSDIEREKSKQEIKAEVEQKIQFIKQQTKSHIESESLKLEAAKAIGDAKAIKEIETKITVSEEEMNQIVESIKNRFAFDSPCRKEFGIVGTGELFDVKSRGDTAYLTYNTATSFYDVVYRRAQQNPELEALLDLMIFSMGHSEHVVSDDQIRNLWVNARREVSNMTKIFVDTMSIKPLPGEQGGEF
jgi:hypothetical protein